MGINSDIERLRDNESTLKTLRDQHLDELILTVELGRENTEVAEAARDFVGLVLQQRKATDRRIKYENAKIEGAR